MGRLVLGHVSQHPREQTQADCDSGKDHEKED